MNCLVTVCNNILFIIIGRRGKKKVFLVPLGCSHDAANNVLSGMSSSNLHTFLHFVYIGHFEMKKGNWAKWNHRWGRAIQLFVFPVPSISDVKLMWPRFLFVSKVVNDTNVEICSLQVIPERDLFNFQSI